VRDRRKSYSGIMYTGTPHLGAITTRNVCPSQVSIKNTSLIIHITCHRHNTYQGSKAIDQFVSLVAELEGVISQKKLFGVGVLVALCNFDPLRATVMPLGEMPSS
jgi:hypothetical protein